MTSNTKTRVGLIQMSCVEEPKLNLERAVTRIRKAAAQGAQIICLPELFKSPYFCQVEEHVNFKLAEEIPGPTSEFLGTLAR
jgi:N-carbamoylputrescine amidase